MQSRVSLSTTKAESVSRIQGADLFVTIFFLKKDLAGESDVQTFRNEIGNELGLLILVQFCAERNQLTVSGALDEYSNKRFIYGATLRKFLVLRI